MGDIENAVIQMKGDHRFRMDGRRKPPSYKCLVLMENGELEWCKKGGARYYLGQVICEESEFIDARKRLENKPSWDEHEYDFVAQCRDGMWVGFYDGVIIGPANHVWYQGIYGGHTIQQGRVFGDWRQSLEPRPQPDNKEGDWCSVGKRVYIKAEPENARIQWDIDQIHEDKGVLISSILGQYWKCRTELEPVVNTLSNARAPKKGQGLPPLRSKEGEGVEWDEDGSFPPGGTTCEAFVRADAKNQYGPAGKWVSGISRGKALASNGGWGGIFEDDDGVMHFVGAQSYFRPIQSRRDKVIEAAMGVAKNVYGRREIDNSCRLTMVELYEEGLLKLPEGEE